MSRQVDVFGIPQTWPLVGDLVNHILINALGKCNIKVRRRPVVQFDNRILYIQKSKVQYLHNGRIDTFQMGSVLLRSSKRETFQALEGGNLAENK
jgi:hypothetical protein